MQQYVDVAITEDFDIAIAENGDFELVDSLNTALVSTFYTDSRADSSEVASPQYQKGWWGNLFLTPVGFQLGSKIWLLNQAVNTQIVLNNAINYARIAFNWLIEFGYADRLEVFGNNPGTGITLTVRIIKNSDIITEKVFNLWKNTLESI